MELQEPLAPKENLPRLSEAEANLKALQLELDSMGTSSSPQRLPVEEQEREEESPQKLVEAAPDEDEARRQRRRTSSGMKLSSTQSFSASPQADLASSPLLQRAVRRSRPNIKPLPTPGQDDEECESSGGSEDEAVASPVAEAKQAPKEAAKAVVASAVVVDVADCKKRFAETAKKYYMWVSEAVEDMSFRDFGATFQEAEAFGEMLAESDRDISEPSEEQYRAVAAQWKELRATKGEDAEPFSSLKLDDVDELFASVLRAMAGRRAAYEQHLKQLRAEEQSQKQQEEARKLKEESERARQQLEEEQRELRAKSEREEAELRKQRDEQEAAELDARQKAEADEKAQAEAKAKAARISIDFDISNELAGLDFESVKSTVPEKKAELEMELKSLVSPAIVEPVARQDPREDAIEVGEEVEAMWDQDGQWYKARIDEKTAFGYWLTFVEYGNAQDTAPLCVRKLVKPKAAPAAAPEMPSQSAGSVPAAGSKLVAKKQKMVKGVGVGAKKQEQSPGAPPVPASQQTPVQEDVRAPVGGIAARMAMLEKEKQALTEPKRAEKRLSGLGGRQEGKLKAAGAQVEAALAKSRVEPKEKKSSSETEEDDGDSDDGQDDGDDEGSDEDATPASTLLIPVKIEQVKAEPKQPDAVVSPRGVKPINVAHAVEAKQEKPASPRGPLPPLVLGPAAAPAPAAKGVSSSSTTHAFPVKSPRTKAATAAAATPAPQEQDLSALSESDRKLLKLREELRKSRETSGSPAKTLPPRTTAGHHKPETSATAAAVAPVALIECMGVNGNEPMPKLTSADEILTVAMEAEVLVAPPTELGEVSDLPPRDKKRYDAAVALIDSEREYYGQLTLLMGLFVVPLRQCKALLGFDILSAQDSEELFGNVPTLWGIHKLFLHALIEAASDWTPENSVTAVLELYAPVFKLYQSYTAHVGKGMVALTKFKTKHARAKEFKDLISSAEASPACAGTNLRSLLNMPVRRPSVYPPLARGIQRATSKEQAPKEYQRLEEVCKLLEAK